MSQDTEIYKNIIANGLREWGDEPWWTTFVAYLKTLSAMGAPAPRDAELQRWAHCYAAGWKAYGGGVAVQEVLSHSFEMIRLSSEEKLQMAERADILAEKLAHFGLKAARLRSRGEAQPELKREAWNDPTLNERSLVEEFSKLWLDYHDSPPHRETAAEASIARQWYDLGAQREPSIEAAHAVYSRAMSSDVSYREGWVANLAMLLYDHFQGADWKDSRQRNLYASAAIDMMFDPKGHRAALERIRWTKAQWQNIEKAGGDAAPEIAYKLSPQLERMRADEAAGSTLDPDNPEAAAGIGAGIIGFLEGKFGADHPIMQEFEKEYGSRGDMANAAFGRALMADWRSRDRDPRDVAKFVRHRDPKVVLNYDGPAAGEDGITRELDASNPEHCEAVGSTVWFLLEEQLGLKPSTLADETRLGRAILREYLQPASAAHLQTFFDERTHVVEDDTGAAKARDIYAAYCEWCTTREVDILLKPAFMQSLVDINVLQIKRRGGTVYLVAREGPAREFMPIGLKETPDVGS